MLVQAYTFPTTRELERIEPVKLSRLTNNSPIFGLFPFQGRRSHILEWEQLDSYGGMTQIRGLNGMPPSVARVGLKKYMMAPGVYGEFIPVDEKELTTRAGTNPATPIPLDEVVLECQDQLLVRRLNRIEWLCWRVVVDGVFAVLDHKGAILHEDQFDVQAYTAPVSISDPQNSTPFANFQAIAPMGRGYSTSFGQGATCYVNQTTGTRILSNRNENDLFGRKINGGNTVMGLGDVNVILSGQGLPRVEIYDEGWLDEDGNFTPYIPDNVGVVIGRRQGNSPLGNFRYTTNANNPGGAPAPYTRVIDWMDKRIPRLIEVHDGFSGGPVLYFPGSILRINF